MQKTCGLLESEPSSVRPHDSMGRTGGLLYLDPDKVTVLLPDIHARMDMVRECLNLVLPTLEGESAPLSRGLEEGWAQLVCVGDYVHGESRVYDRWLMAQQEFLNDFRHHKAMDQEMTESLGTVELLMHLKLAFPNQIHLLKGNHENITNEEGHGNHPFRKFAQEGPMVFDWMQRFYPENILSSFDRLEKNYPLVAVGDTFLVSHAEPLRFFDPSEVIEYRSRPDVVMGLTWTENNRAQDGAVEEMLSVYLGLEPNSELWNQAYHFAGHRVVTGLYQTRAMGRFVQFHNPNLRIAAILHPQRSTLLDRDILSF